MNTDIVVVDSSYEIVQSEPTNAGDYYNVGRGATDEYVVEMWLDTGKRANSPLTQDAYLRTYRQFAAYVGKPLQAITLDDLRQWRNSLAGKQATRRTKIAIIRSLFSFAVKQLGYLRMNPAIMLDVPSEPDRTKRRTLTEGNIERLVDVCSTSRESALVRCLYSSGARISEILSLRWRDVTPRDNGRAILSIERGKGGKSREAGISAATYKALLALREEHTQPDDYVFATRSGAALDRQAAHKTLKRLLKRAGLPQDASPHWLRHSHATHVLARGGNVADLQKQLGHSSLATTSRYAHAQAYSADKLAI